MSSIEDWACNYLVASLFILDLLHCAPKSICQIQFVHKMEAGQKIVAITRHILTLEQVLYLDMCYIRTSLTFGRVLRLDKCYIWQVLHLDKCYTFGQVSRLDMFWCIAMEKWDSSMRRHIGMEVTQQLGFARIQPALSCSALALKCARTLCAINGRDQNAMHYIETWKLSCPPVSISLYDVLELVNEGFTATGLPGLPPSCHLMGSRLPKPHLADNSVSASLDFNFPNVLQLPSQDYLNKSVTRPEPLTKLQQTWWDKMCTGGGVYERKCCQTGVG